MPDPTSPRRGPQHPRWLPYALIGLAVAASFALSGWALPFGPVPVAVGGVLAAAHRALADARGDRWGRLGRVAWFVTFVVGLAALVAVAPMFCVYAFLGYFDAARFLPRRAITAGLFATAAITAAGQAGGVVGISTMPWLFVVLLAVNGSIAPVMERLGRQRETELDERERALAELEAEQRRSAALQEELLDAARAAGVQDERERLSREIHDTVAQGLIAIVTQLEAIGPDADEASWRPRVERATRQARDSLAEARRAISALGSPRLTDDDLPRALRQMTAEWADANGVRAEVRVDGEARHGPLDEPLLRIAQESLANVARHACANRVVLTLSYLTDRVCLDVRDDGRGFDPDATPPGTGVTGMRDRLAQFGGILRLETSPGRGCTVSAAVPT